MTAAGPVLAVVAHADDETIGAGGALARHADEGREVYVLVLADGESSRGTADSARVEERRDQCRRACGILGVREVFFETFPDNAMDDRTRLEVAKACERYLGEIGPTTIYTHHRGDVNIDHVYASEAVTIAARAQPGCVVRRILHFETASSSEWQLPAHRDVFAPNWFVDISEVWDRKIAALEVYRGEMRDFPHPRSVRALDVASAWRGVSAGLARAEAFMLVRSIE